ncbi:hypothetical protein BWK58_05545, partial [Flavobacterium columnare]
YVYLFNFNYKTMGRIGISELLIFALCFVIPTIMFVMSCKNILKSIKPENRQIELNKIAHILIPIYGIYFIFILIKKINKSLELEIKPLNKKDFYYTDYRIGNTNGFLYCFSFLPLIALFFLIANILILFKVNRLQKQLNVV